MHSRCAGTHPDALPHLRHEFFVSDDLPGLLHENSQDVERPRTKRDRGALPLQGSFNEAEAERAEQE